MIVKKKKISRKSYNSHTLRGRVSDEDPLDSTLVTMVLIRILRLKFLL